MSDDDNVINLSHRVMARGFQRMGAEYDRIRPQFEAIQAGCDPHCYTMECIRQLAQNFAATGLTLEEVIDQLLGEAEMYDTESAVKILDAVKQRLIHDDAETSVAIQQLGAE